LIVVYILLGFAALIVGLLCVRIRAVIDYDESLRVEASYLFLKFQLYPAPEKKPKKPKPEKEEPEEKKKKEPKPKEPGGNILARFYKNQGLGGVLELLGAVKDALGGMLGRMWRTIVIHDLYLDISVTDEDAAATAIKYGRVCAVVYPCMGKICSGMRVRRYDLDVQPDYLALQDKAALYCTLSVRPIDMTNAMVILAAQFAWKVLLKLYKGAKSSEDKAPKQQAEQKENIQKGAS